MSYVILALCAFAGGCVVTWLYKDAIVTNLKEML